MSHPENDPSLEPSLPAPGAAPTLTAPQPGTDAPTLAPPPSGAGDAPLPESNGSMAPGPGAPTLDGDAPRLGSTAPMSAPTAPPGISTSAPTAPAAPSVDTPPPVTPTLELPSLPSLPTASPVLTSPAGLASPDDGIDATGPRPAAPAPVPVPDDAAASSTTETPSEPVHPMAHLMPEKAAPSESSRKAAELRAAKKAKAKKIKIGVAAGFLVVAVVVGPPLWGWLTNAINESGSTSTEEPAD